MSGQSSLRSNLGSGRVNFGIDYSGSLTFSDIGQVRFESNSDRVQFQVRVVLSWVCWVNRWYIQVRVRVGLDNYLVG